MDVKWLEDFVALARTRSFSAAARERHVTQPAFSRRIRALESWAGVSLVDRSSHPIAITAAGRKFRETAEETIRMLGSARDDLRAGSDTVRPTVFVAALHTLATGFFPSMVLAGHGTAWLPRSLVHSELADGRLATTGRHLPLEIRLHRNVDRRRSIVQSIWDCSAHIMQDKHKVGRYGIGRWPLAPSIHALDQG